MRLLRSALLGTVAASHVVSGGGAPTDAFYSNVGLLAEMGVPIDKSSSAYAITLFNQEEMDTSPANGTRSMFFGTLPNSNTTQANYGQVTDTTFPGLSNSDFTIEAYIGGAAEPGQTTIMGRFSQTGGTNSWRFYWDATNNRIVFGYSLDGTTEAITAYFDCDTDGVTTATVWNGSMHHVAACRVGTSVRVFVDGVLGSGVAAIGTGTIFATSHPLRLGAHGDAADSARNYGVNVNFDDFRITIGTGRYTTGFTPASYVIGVGDAAWANVKLLLNFEENFGTYWTSPNGKTTTRNSRAVAANPLLGSKGYEGKTGNYYINWLPVTDWSMGSGEFCIEVFGLEFKAIAATRQIVGAYGTAGTRSWRIVQNGATTCAFVYSTDGTAETTVAFAYTFAINTQYNICVERTGTTLRLFVNGVQTATATMAGTVFAVTANYLSIGARANGFVTGNEGLDGYVKAVRYTYASRYGTTPYTVPSLPLPRA